MIPPRLTLGNNNDERERLEHVALDESGSMQIKLNPIHLGLQSLG